MISSHSWLSRPSLIGDFTDKLQLLHHIIVAKQIPVLMAREATLRAHTQPLECILLTFAAIGRNVLGCLLDSLLHLFLVLQLRELAGDDTQDHVLVLGQLLERLKASSTRGV